MKTIVNEVFIVGMNEQMGQFVEMLEVHMRRVQKVFEGALKILFENAK